MNSSNDPSINTQSAEKVEASLANRDPITGAPGSHPVATGVGSASGAAAGVAAGTLVGGPVGAVVGGVVGAVAGGLVGKAAGESVNPTEEDTFWRARYRTEPYFITGRVYDDYAPAYRTGYEARAALVGQTFEQAEADLHSRYDGYRGKSMLEWAQARAATRAAWDRVGARTAV
ncbi:MAG: hypothetical protein IPK97_05770 [Ahniella sp.]|nr:hypothetical protein [Ahniella sp.]